jgi:hypothetical protein
MTNQDDDLRALFDEEDEDTNLDDIFGDETTAARDNTLPNDELASTSANTQATSKFLGMTAGERALLSVLLFFTVLVVGILLLITTGRIL